MDLHLKGKVAIVTGGTRGIGRTIVETLCVEGCRTVFCARKAEDVEDAQRAFDASGVETLGLVADVGDADSYAAFLARASTAFGGVDVFVPSVSAGGGMGDEKFWRNSFEIDVLGTIRGCEAMRPVMAANGGSIVLISSTAALEAFVGPMAYNAMKAALLNYAKNLSQQVGPSQIRVNAVAPGPVLFPGSSWDKRRTGAPEVFASTLARIPLGRYATPQDVANTVAFLASPLAAYITGVTVTVDGGFTKRVDY